MAHELVPTDVNQLWIADITYIRLQEEFVFLAAILDAFSRRAIGWALDRNDAPARTVACAVPAPCATRLRSARLDCDSRLAVRQSGLHRSRNGFDGMNVGQVVLSPKGTFRTNEMDSFHTLWRSECSGKMGREEVDAVTLLLDHPTS